MTRVFQHSLWLAACAQLAACALESDGNEVDDLGAALRATEEASDISEAQELERPSVAERQNNGSSDTKSKSDLENDGYTCRALEGTTLTLCWKNGSPGYSCDPEGRCIQNARTSPGSRFGTVHDISLAEAQLLGAKTPFCLPGEKRVCKLGPPPVCTCEPLTPPIVVEASFAP
ncbi:MAG TPA: hypothetical protein VJR89_38965 [Polyangiales bacterium]|nr:hypothetical protein [Polyangiales bacterium]